MISIVTPSHCQPDWLRLCTASIADQEGAAFEHIIQDTGKTEGLDSIVKDFPDAKVVREADEGMYDAVNRGMEKAGGDILCYLNCDEQFLPGALKEVEEAFEADPELDVLFGDTVLVGESGDFLAYRKSVLPTFSVASVCPLPILTCATFIRRRVFHDLGVKFDTDWKELGDAQWCLQLIKSGVKMRCLRRYTSVFALTGENLSFTSGADGESKKHMSQAPFVFRCFRPIVRIVHRIDKMRQGCYKQDPFEYEIYTMKQPSERRRFDVPTPSFRYPEVIRETSD